MQATFSRYLVDICESFLTLSQEHLASKGLSNNIMGCTQASATDLRFIPDNSVDCVLMLGPFYHLTDQNQRDEAVAEASRVLKTDGLLFAAAINRLAIFHELFKSDRFFDSTEINIQHISKELEEYCQTGVSNAQIFQPLGDAYLATISEFSALFSSSFDQVDFLGVESFSSYKQKKIFEKNPEDLEMWLSFLEKMSRTPEGRACSEHFLYVGKKRN